MCSRIAYALSIGLLVSLPRDLVFSTVKKITDEIMQDEIEKRRDGDLEDCLRIEEWDTGTFYSLNTWIIF